MTVLSTILDYFDVALLLVITLIAYDALRQLHAANHPIRAAAFSLLSVGAFGWIMIDLSQDHVPWWALTFHLGVALHSIVRFGARNIKGRDYAARRLYHR